MKYLLLAGAILLHISVYAEPKPTKVEVLKPTRLHVDTWTAGAVETAIRTIGSETPLKVAGTSGLALAFLAVSDERPMVVEYCLVGLTALDPQGSKKAVLVLLSRDPYSLTSSFQWSTEIDRGFAFDGSKLPGHVSVQDSFTPEKVWEFWADRTIKGHGMKPVIEVKLEEQVLAFVAEDGKSK